MDDLYNWADRWGVPRAAVVELIRMALPDEYHPGHPGSESAAQAETRLVAAKAGIPLWRNNRGEMITEAGGRVRFGLANDSKKLGDRIKSSDLIGVIRGGKIVSIEMKRPGWEYSGTLEEQAQLRWLAIINAMGGVGRFATGPEDIRDLL